MTNDDLINKLKNEGTLKTPNIIKAFKDVDRIEFVPENFREEAYCDYPIQIGAGQTISQPTTVAFMLELLKPKRGNKVLDIGAGSGWLTALIAQIVGRTGYVYALEINQEIGELGVKNLSKFGNFKMGYKIADARSYWSKHAPYDRIIASAAFSEIPNKLKNLLKEGGVMVVPTKNNELIRIIKTKTKYIEKTFPGFVFVPLQ